MAIGITQYVNRKLSITDNVLDRNLVIDVISNASDFVTPFTLFHPLYKMNALERNLLTAAGATGDIFECLARMDFNLASGLEYNLLAALIEEYGLDYPAIVANLGYNVWNWDASDTSKLFQDSAGATPVTANNDPVGRWVDRIQAVPATQGTTAAKATYKTNTLNGLATLAFDGGDILATANISISTFALWVVYQRTTAAGVLYEQSENAITGNGFTSTNNLYAARRSGSLSRYSWTDTLSTWHINRHESQATHALNKLYQDGVEIIGSSVSAGNPGTGTVTNALYIGARTSIVNPLVGNIAQLIIVSPYPIAEIITNMESWVNTKWGGVY